jgi:hypothetical protein
MCSGHSVMDVVNDDKGLTTLALEIVCDQTAIAYYLSRLQYFSKLSSFSKTWVSQRNLCDVSATPSGIDRDWYVGM